MKKRSAVLLSVLIIVSCFIIALPVYSWLDNHYKCKELDELGMQLFVVCVNQQKINKFLRNNVDKIIIKSSDTRLADEIKASIKKQLKEAEEILKENKEYLKLSFQEKNFTQKRMLILMAQPILQAMEINSNIKNKYYSDRSPQPEIPYLQIPRSNTSPSDIPAWIKKEGHKT